MPESEPMESNEPLPFVTNSHARWRMRRREVSDEAIAWVLEHYDLRMPARPLPRTKPAEILIGVFEGRRLKVYVEIGSEPPKVKTAAWEQ